MTHEIVPFTGLPPQETAGDTTDVQKMLDESELRMGAAVSTYEKAVRILPIVRDISLRDIAEGHVYPEAIEEVVCGSGAAAQNCLGVFEGWFESALADRTERLEKALPSEAMSVLRDVLETPGGVDCVAAKDLIRDSNIADSEKSAISAILDANRWEMITKLVNSLGDQRYDERLATLSLIDLTISSSTKAVQEAMRAALDASYWRVYQSDIFVRGYKPSLEAVQEVLWSVSASAREVIKTANDYDLLRGESEWGELLLAAAQSVHGGEAQKALNEALESGSPLVRLPRPRRAGRIDDSYGWWNAVGPDGRIFDEQA